MSLTFLTALLWNTASVELLEKSVKQALPHLKRYHTTCAKIDPRAEEKGEIYLLGDDSFSERRAIHLLLTIIGYRRIGEYIRKEDTGSRVEHERLHCH